MNQMVLINEIMRLTLLVNNVSEHTIFIEYAGHVNTLDCRVHVNGWRKDNKWTKDFHVRLNSDDCGCFMLNKIKEYINDLYMNTEIVELEQKGAECFA
ncbi:hypothetical protein SH1V18_15230 [Vallitalea longa]|uniref:Uncharacterized protein n=2 Tax=Vallitalea longa TaxID=2936439 RepID=A0A9W6DF33_9FIRM|nr:hypothetical protein SH1V18_15230 [Vallitalea longa]